MSGLIDKIVGLETYGPRIKHLLGALTKRIDKLEAALTEIRDLRSSHPAYPAAIRVIATAVLKSEGDGG